LANGSAGLFPPPALLECRHSGLQGCSVAVRSAKCSGPRRVAKTSASQSTPFALQVAASRAPLLRMRSLWTGYLSARHDFWPRPLSVDTHPTVTTCKANNWKDAGSSDSPNLATSAALVVGHDVPPSRRGKSRPVVSRDGSGRFG